MAVVKFRVLLDYSEHVFRDLEIKDSQTFSELHDAITHAFSFSGREMASFFLSNETWDKGLEIPLMDMGPELDIAGKSMDNTTIGEHIAEEGDRLLYVYDFLRFWVFMLEVLEWSEAEAAEEYPMVTLAFGEAPDEEDKAMDLQFEGDMIGMEDDDDFGDADFDEEDDTGGYYDMDEDFR